LPWALRSRFGYRMLELHRHWTVKNRLPSPRLNRAAKPTS
jgi:hypothetical protein